MIIIPNINRNTFECITIYKYKVVWPVERRKYYIDIMSHNIMPFLWVKQGLLVGLDRDYDFIYTDIFTS